jgi:hypothetical protein
MTPARLEAHRRSAQKSTGPRTARGKAQWRMNARKNGRRSSLHRQLLIALLNAEPGEIEAAAQSVLTPEQPRHPLFAQELEIAREAEIGLIQQRGKEGRKKGTDFLRLKPECY